MHVVQEEENEERGELRVHHGLVVSAVAVVLLFYEEEKVLTGLTTMYADHHTIENQKLPEALFSVRRCKTAKSQKHHTNTVGTTRAILFAPLL